MSYAPQPMQPVPVHKPPKSKVTLFLGLGCFFVALLGIILVVWGGSRVSTGVGDLSEQASTLDPVDDPSRTVVALNVPGQTQCQLEPDDYVIWAKVPADAWTRNGESGESEDEAGSAEPDNNSAEPDHSGFDDWDDGKFGTLVDLPEVTWTIEDESNQEIPVYTETNGFYADEVQAGRFTIQSSGSYTIRAEVEELPPGYSFRLLDDVTEEQIEQAARNVGNVAGGFMLIFAGGAMAGLFGLIGLILLIVYLVT